MNRVNYSGAFASSDSLTVPDTTTAQQFTVPLVYPGTPFQLKVWSGLLRIPYGETRSYEELAVDVGSRGAQCQAVRGAATARA